MQGGYKDDDAPDIGNKDNPSEPGYNEYEPIGEPGDKDIYVPSPNPDGSEPPDTGGGHDPSVGSW